MKSLNSIALLLAVVGAINWGLIGLFNLNLVSALLGSGTFLEKVVYILVGLSGALIGYNALTKAK